MNVTLIGSGNLAWHLGPALENSGYAIREVFSRSAARAGALVEKLYAATPRGSLDFSASPSRIFILCVPDDAINPITRDIILPDNGMLLHASGSQPLQILEYAGVPSTGVFYPLQTFTKSRKTDFSEIPIFIESHDPETLKVIAAMARSLSKKVFSISSEERRRLHLGAVFASNFVNYMLTISKELLAAKGLPFDHLRPLIIETVNKALTLGPEQAQTGPAKRGDLEILDAHLSLLEEDETTKEIYRIISQDILDRYNTSSEG